MNLNLEPLHICSLIIGFFTKFPRDVLVEFLLNKARDGRFDVFIDLQLDFTRVVNRHCEHVKQTLLTFFGEVVQNFRI